MKIRSFFKVTPRIVTPNEKKVVLENFASLSTLQGLGYLLPILVLPYLIRIIGPEKFGLIAFAQAFVQYFMILTDYGFSISATRKISLCKGEKEKLCAIFSSVMTVKLILAAISFLILLAIITYVPRFKQDWLVYIFSFGAVVGNTLFPAWFFQGKEKMIYIARINVIGGITYAISLFIFVRSPQDYLYVPLLNSLFFLVTGLLGLYIAFKKFSLEFVFQSYEDIQQELKTGWHIFISVLAINTYTATRVFAVGLLTNNIITGYYSIADRLASFIQSFPMDSFTQAIYPRFNKVFNKNKKRALRLMYKAQSYTTTGFIICLPILFFFAPLIVRLFCGISYPEVVLALRILVVSVFLVGANAFRVQFLLVSGRTDIYSRLHVAAALLGLPLIFILIHYFSYLGAALSKIIIEAGVIIVTFRLVKNLTKDIYL
ncbi:MAG: flippase [bacterium]